MKEIIRFGINVARELYREKGNNVLIKATHLVQCNIVVQNIIDVKATSSKYLIFMSGRDGRYSSSAGRRGQEELSLIKYFSITINKKTIERLLQPRA